MDAHSYEVLYKFIYESSWPQSSHGVCNGNWYNVISYKILKIVVATHNVPILICSHL